MNGEVALVDFRGPIVALADALQVKLGVLEVLPVNLPVLLDVDLGLVRNFDGRGLLFSTPVLTPHAAIDTITRR